MRAGVAQTRQTMIEKTKIQTVRILRALEKKTIKCIYGAGRCVAALTFMQLSINVCKPFWTHQANSVESDKTAQIHILI